jgi:hypothetical protein
MNFLIISSGMSIIGACIGIAAVRQRDWASLCLIVIGALSLTALTLMKVW